LFYISSSIHCALFYENISAYSMSTPSPCPLVLAYLLELLELAPSLHLVCSRLLPRFKISVFGLCFLFHLCQTRVTMTFDFSVSLNYF
jgi:hypothetical protein